MRSAGNGTVMNGKATQLVLVAAVALAVAAATRPAGAASGGTAVRDIVHLRGIRSNKLMATSLVVGLKKTGDGKSLETQRSLVHMLRQFGHDGVTMHGINADNIALVHVTATIPPHGANEGDRLDVRVSSINGAKSLQGGRLVQCPMLGPLAAGPIVYALADGDVILDDPKNTTGGIIKGGAVMEENFEPTVLDDGKIVLVMDADHASWAIATTVAKIINEAEAEPGTYLATAMGRGRVVVTVPTAELAAPADFIARVLNLPVLMPDLKARVVINRRTGTIVITDDVRIDPVIFSQNGLTITTVSPRPKPTEENPKIDVSRFQVFAPGTAGGTTNAQNLVDAFNQLQVPVQDQIAAIYTLKRTGRLHAEVIED